MPSLHSQMRGLFRFLNDATVKGYGYYCRQIDFNRKNLFSRNYGDFFAGRMVFPIYDADAGVTGMVGRHAWAIGAFAGSSTRPGKSPYPPKAGSTALKRQGTVYPAVTGRSSWWRACLITLPFTICSTARTNWWWCRHWVPISLPAAAILKSLDIENYIAAYDWDELGRNGIERTAVQSGGWVYYLGGLADGQDPYDKLEPVASAISGFSLKHL